MVKKEVLLAQDNHAFLAPGQHHVSSPLIVKEARTNGANNRHDHIVSFVA